MSWSKKQKKVFKILVIDGSMDIRQKLIEYYQKILKRLYAKKDKSIVYRAKSVLEAEKKIDHSRIFDLDLIIFSFDFPQDKKDELREWLSCLHVSTPFITVPLGSPAEVI